MKLTFDDHYRTAIEFPTVVPMRDRVDGEPGYQMPAVNVFTKHGVEWAHPYFASREAADTWLNATAELFVPHAVSFEFVVRDIIARENHAVRLMVIDPVDDRPGREVQVVEQRGAIAMCKIILATDGINFFQEFPGSFRLLVEPGILLGDHPSPLLIGEKFQKYS